MHPDTSPRRGGQAPGQPSPWQLEVFFDGACPLCRREMAWLRRRIPQGEVRFSDLSAPDFPPAGLGVGREQLLAQLHARLPDGRWLRGVEVFRRLYAAAGWGALAAVSRWPVVRQLLEAGYGVFARQRLRWSGRCAAGCRRGAGT